MKIKVLVVEPMMIPKAKEIENDLDIYKEIVGGWIECIYPFNDSVCVVCNEEAKLIGLPLNRELEHNGKVYDIIAGTFFVVGIKGEDFRSLTEEEIKKYSEYYKEPKMFIRTNRGIMSVPVPLIEEVG